MVILLGKFQTIKCTDFTPTKISFTPKIMFSLFWIFYLTNLKKYDKKLVIFCYLDFSKTFIDGVVLRF